MVAGARAGLSAPGSAALAGPWRVSLFPVASGEHRGTHMPVAPLCPSFKLPVRATLDTCELPQVHSAPGRFWMDGQMDSVYSHILRVPAFLGRGRQNLLNQQASLCLREEGEGQVRGLGHSVDKCGWRRTRGWTLGFLPPGLVWRWGWEGSGSLAGPQPLGTPLPRFLPPSLRGRRAVAIRGARAQGARAQR